MPDYLKPIPQVDEVSKTYWKGCQRREILVQHCRACDHRWHYPRPLCPNCFSEDFEWERCTGNGKIYSYTVNYQNMSPGFLQELPYVLALIDLDEGPRMLSNVVGAKPEDLRIGLPVTAVFEPISREITLPKFRVIG